MVLRGKPYTCLTVVTVFIRVPERSANRRFHIVAAITDSRHPLYLCSTLIKSTIFGVIISVISCAWGVTTNGGAKGVGESTTSAVVISLVVIFIADFVLSFLFFQGAGDSLKAALG